METKQQITLIRKQAAKLNDPDFDLEAWKNGTILILSRIFGQTSLVVSKIQNLSFHLSSWALRDTLGKTSTVEQVKHNAREMLETAVMELETIGIPDSGASKNKGIPALTQALENELKVAQYRELKQILTDTTGESDRYHKVMEFLSPFDTDSLRRILSSVLADEQAVTSFRP